MSDRDTYEELCDAAEQGNLDEVDALYAQVVEGGQDVDARSDTQGRSQFSALGLACLNGHLPVVKRLIDLGADPKKTKLRNSVVSAAQGGHLDVVEYLLELGLSPNQGEDDGYQTPLHVAAYHGRVDLIEYLLSVGADPNIKNESSVRPVDSALECDECFRILFNAMDKKFRKRTIKLFEATTKRPAPIE